MLDFGNFWLIWYTPLISEVLPDYHNFWHTKEDFLGGDRHSCILQVVENTISVDTMFPDKPLDAYVVWNSFEGAIW